MQNYFTSFGMIDAPDQQTADRLAYVRYLEDGWRQGGYYPMTREEFEASHPEAALENNQDDSSGTRGQ